MANVKLSELPAAGAAPVAADRLAGVQVAGPTDKTWTIANIFTSPAATTSITTGSTTFALLNTTATTVNAFGAATTLNIGASATCILNFGGSTTASEFRFLEPSGSGTNYTAFKAQAQGASITYTLPATVGAAGTVLTDSAGNGTLSWTAAGSGTVTVVGAGSLTSTALVTGGGTTTLQTPSATATMDTSGNIATPGSLSTGVGGSVAGNIALTQGTAPSAGTTNVTIFAPASVTSYLWKLPAAAATGFVLGTNSAGTVTLSHVGSTGSGTVVLDTSPTLTTPVLGTPTSGTLTNCTVDGTNLLGYRGAPQNSQSAAYTTVLGDAGKCIFHPSTDNNARTFTIDSNANVAYPVGTIIEFINMAAASATIAITSDTMTLLPAGTTGSRTLAQYGRASAEKISSTAWVISGNSALT